MESPNYDGGPARKDAGMASFELAHDSGAFEAMLASQGSGTRATSTALVTFDQHAQVVVQPTTAVTAMVAASGSFSSCGVVLPVRQHYAT